MKSKFNINNYWKLYSNFNSLFEFNLIFEIIVINKNITKAAVGSLRKVSTYLTAEEKLDCLKTAANNVELLIKNVFKKPFGADEFLPFFCLVMMEANPLYLESECNFIDDFMPEEGKCSMPGYLLAQLQITSSFICDYQHKSLRK